MKDERHWFCLEEKKVYAMQDPNNLILVMCCLQKYPVRTPYALKQELCLTPHECVEFLRLAALRHGIDFQENQRIWLTEQVFI